MNFSFKQIGKICQGQDGCIWGNTLFRFDGDGNCWVYDLNDLAPMEDGEAKCVAKFRLDRADEICPHSNSVCFGAERFADDDQFPLLYTNIYNAYNHQEDEMWGVCCVYRLQRDGDSFKTTLAQIIEVGFAHDAELWCSRKPGEGRDIRPFGNFTVDAERGKYYGFVMRDTSHKTRFFEFALPKLQDGALDEKYGVNRVVLTPEDVLSKFDCDYSNYLQGACVHNGIIYSIEGGSKSFDIPATLMVVDPKSGLQAVRISLIYYGMEYEPEFICYTGDRCIYSDNMGNLFELMIEI